MAYVDQKNNLIRLYNKILINEAGKPICMLGEPMSLYNPYTAHHIVPKRNGGIDHIDNLALLTHIAHIDFNLIEQYIPSRAKEINEGFLDFKLYKNIDIVRELKEYKDYLLSTLGIEPDMSRIKILKKYN